MAIVKKQLAVASCDGVHLLQGVVFTPIGVQPKGFFHVVHGMTEHIGRYETFMSAMAQEGWICFGYDHLGHGKTAREPRELGYIAKKRGWELLSGDVKRFSDAVFAEYGGRSEKMPYCLMGHSMGSFIVRLAVERYVKPDRLVIMGTGGTNPAAGPGLALIGVIKAIRGGHYVSPFVYRLAFGHYNDRFGGGSAQDPSPWLTTDGEIRAKHYTDPLCRFRFTVSAMGDLIRLMKYANRAPWYRKLPKELPILLVSGEEDPVGNYGKGVRQVYKRLQKQSLPVRCVLYPGARHELLNDFTYEDVKREILDFCQSPKE